MKHRMLSLTVAVALSLCAVHSVPAVSMDIGDTSRHVDGIRKLYNAVNNTPPSVINAEEHRRIIKERLDCYKNNKDYISRQRICNSKYTKDLVRVARKHIKSRPSSGLFVANVGLCPVLYNICIGQTNENKERCIDFERQCIDYNLDIYWRGAPQYGQHYYMQ